MFKCQHPHGENWFLKRICITIIFVSTSPEKSWLSFIFITSVPSIPSMRKYWVVHPTCSSSFPSGSLSSCQKIDASSLCSTVWMGHCHPAQPWQWGVTPIDFVNSDAARPQQRLRSCSSGCYTTGEKRWILPRSAYRQRKEGHTTARDQRLLRNNHDVVRVFKGGCLRR